MPTRLMPLISPLREISFCSCLQIIDLLDNASKSCFVKSLFGKLWSLRFIYVGNLLDRRQNHVEPRRRPYRWYSYQPEHHKLWGSCWIPTPSLVELYGSSTQECGVDRGAESSDTSSLNERLGIFLREKDLHRVIVPSRFVGWPPLYIVKGKLKRGPPSLSSSPQSKGL